MEGDVDSLPVAISPSSSLGSLDTLRAREREDCEAISRAVVIYNMAKAWYGIQKFLQLSLWWMLTVEESTNLLRLLVMSAGHVPVAGKYPIFMHRVLNYSSVWSVQQVTGHIPRIYNSEVLDQGVQGLGTYKQYLLWT